MEATKILIFGIAFFRQIKYKVQQQNEGLPSSQANK